MRSRGRLHVGLMGLDGTGKSTQADRLMAHATADGFRPVRIHHPTPMFPPLRWLKKALHGPLLRGLGAAGSGPPRGPSPDAGLEKRVGPGRVGLKPLLGWLLLISSFTKAWTRHLLFVRRGLVLDRTFLDDVVQARWRLRMSPGLGRVLMRLSPKPTVTFALELPPEVSYGRKKTQNVSFEAYAEKAQVFQSVLTDAGEHGWRIVRIPVEGRSIEAVWTSIERVLCAGEAPVNNDRIS